jgi:secretion/DNA translocation related TadE-like protein
VWLLGLASLVVLAGVAGAGRGAAVVARHRVEAAADLAALAAATRLAGGSTPPCAAAAQVARANWATLLGCRLTGPDVEVEAVATLSFGRLGRYQVLAQARAGPADGVLADGVLGQPPGRAGWP